jgi:transglutaminase-like putative cysteine protease
VPFQINAWLHYVVHERSTVLLGIHAHSSPNQTLRDETFVVTPGVAWEELPREPGGNRYIRLDTGDAGQLDISYSVTAETRCAMVGLDEIHRIPIARIRYTKIPYLFPSRYCQSDRLWRLAMKMFGTISHPYDQVRAISDWIFENIDYLYGTTNVETSAFDTVTQRAGVCRDFAHLGIAFCRALSIPARYFTGYACHMRPPDFHACFEACIGNRWFVFDPTRLASLNGLVRIATGRDAADASVATIFGRMDLTGMTVSCVSADFVPLAAEDLKDRALVIEG